VERTRREQQIRVPAQVHVTTLAVYHAVLFAQAPSAALYSFPSPLRSPVRSPLVVALRLVRAAH